jgi:periplasmic protein TonB
MGGFTWAVVGSIGTHLVLLAGASAFGVGVAGEAPSPAPVPIEVVRLPAPEPRPAPPPVRKPETVRPPRQVKAPVAKPDPAPIQPSTLLEDTRALDLPVPRTVHPAMADNAVMSHARAVIPGPREGGAAGAGKLSAMGDLPVTPGKGASGGSGAGGRAGAELSASGTDDAIGGAAGVTSFARPLGGYQTIPHYPESARRAGVEGVTLLRFVVQADGRVGTVNVERSAGHPELDQSAVDAVKAWRFEPAHRGKDPVPVWVTLPVRFELTSR